MDVDREYGKTLYGSLSRSHHYGQGIAVHPDMTYALIRPAEQIDEGAGVFIVALERLDALSKILGKADIIGKVRGC